MKKPEIFGNASSLNWLLTIVLGLFCFSARAQETAKSEPPRGVTQVILQRTWCYGSCPIDRLVLNSDGTATYQGNMIAMPRFIEKTEQGSTPAEAKLPIRRGSTARMSGLYAAFLASDIFSSAVKILEQQGFFDMKPSYNDENIDVPDVIISAQRDGLDYTVVRHGSSTNFWLLEKFINGVGADLRWTKDEAASNNGIEGSTWRDFNPAEKTQFAHANIEGVPVLYTKIIVSPANNVKAVYRTLADSRGHFQMMLPPGEYKISASGDYKPLAWPRPKDWTLPSEFLWSAETQTIKVEAGKFTEVKMRAKSQNH